MKNIIKKYGLMALASIAVLGFTSCAADDEDYAAGESDPGAYLYTDNADITLVPDDAQSFILKVGRTDSTTAGTVELKKDNDAFKAPSTVSFAAGQSVVEVPVTFDMEIGTKESVTFSVPSEQATVYGHDSLTVTVNRDYTWQEAGYGTFDDELFSGYKGTVYVEKAKERDGLYRLVSPYANVYKQNGESDLPTGGNIQFTFKDGKASMADGEYVIDESGKVISYTLNYDAANNAQECFVTVDGSVLTFHLLALKGGKVEGSGSFIFTWDDSFPE
ncbi:MAG: hypothetical protein K6A82_00070 [Prevotella sp.]|nr:hypothetical protein [Prevotella sp.]